MSESQPEPRHLDDPTLPVNPEHVARALGAALSRSHSQPVTPQLPVLELESLAASLVARSSELSTHVVTDGPYLGRPIMELARLGMESVHGLPPSQDSHVATISGFTLADATIELDGTVVLSSQNTSADRHIDLAAAAIGLGERHGAAAIAPMFDAYGMDRIDLRRLDTCQLLVTLQHELEAAESRELDR